VSAAGVEEHEVEALHAVQPRGFRSSTLVLINRTVCHSYVSSQVRYGRNLK
jgi:hypothetical protein